MVTKQQLRNWAKEERKKLDVKSVSKVLFEKLQSCKEYISAKNVMIFYPKENEVDLLALLEDKSKQFFLPRIDGEKLLCCPYKIGDELEESCFRTKEPCTAPVNINKLDLIIIPALAVDKENYRLGYGGGYYDRLLEGVGNNITKIVCLPKQLVVDTVYPEEHDIKLDFIITN